MNIITDTAGTAQFSDVDASLLAGSDSIGGLVSAMILNQAYTSDIYISKQKLQVYLNETSAAERWKFDRIWNSSINQNNIKSC